MGRLILLLIALLAAVGAVSYAGMLIASRVSDRRRDAAAQEACKSTTVECPTCGNEALITGLIKHVSASTTQVKVSCRCGYVGSRYVT